MVWFVHYQGSVRQCVLPISIIHFTDFKKRNTGHVINIGSVAGREPYAGGGIYCATKHAVRSFTGSLLRELVDTPIRVTEIQPGKHSLGLLNAKYLISCHRFSIDFYTHFFFYFYPFSSTFCPLPSSPSPSWRLGNMYSRHGRDRVFRRPVSRW